MDIPTPKPGLVIRYAYLWADEHDQGKEEGSKDRPVAIIVATKARHNQLSVAVLPITHTPPATGAEAMEIPPETKRRLNLDDDRSWVILDELYRRAKITTLSARRGRLNHEDFFLMIFKGLATKWECSLRGA